jgi:hypothetical protein
VRWVIAAVGTILVVLTPLAYASPVDPTWRPGFWDDDDFDDVILFLTSNLDLVHAGDLPIVAVAGTLAAPVFERPAPIVPRDVYEPGASRAPPCPSLAGANAPVTGLVGVDT